MVRERWDGRDVASQRVAIMYGLIEWSWSQKSDSTRCVSPEPEDKSLTQPTRWVMGCRCVRHTPALPRPPCRPFPHLGKRYTHQRIPAPASSTLQLHPRRTTVYPLPSRHTETSWLKHWYVCLPRHGPLHRTAAPFVSGRGANADAPFTCRPRVREATGLYLRSVARMSDSAIVLTWPFRSCRANRR